MTRLVIQRPNKQDSLADFAIVDEKDDFTYLLGPRSAQFNEPVPALTPTFDRVVWNLGWAGCMALLTALPANGLEKSFKRSLSHPREVPRSRGQGLQTLLRVRRQIPSRRASQSGFRRIAGTPS